MLEENLARIFSEIKGGNDRGEKITLVGATKTVNAETINAAVRLGLKIVAENRVQEFREKTALIKGATQHFIGHLQTNKVKYLVGNVALIQSVDSLRLAEAIDEIAAKKFLVQNVLAEVNVGGEESKSGFDFLTAEDNLKALAEFKNIKVKGIMAMLPQKNNDDELIALCKKARALFDKMKEIFPYYEYLSMGMSGDYKIAVKNGSNMIRIGSGIFGKRNYEVN